MTSDPVAICCAPALCRMRRTSKEAGGAMPESSRTLESVAASRWYVAVCLTVTMMVIYFGFILLVAFQGPMLGTLVSGGLRLGMLIGALVLLMAVALTWAYAWWANLRYDSSIQELRRDHRPR
jgi:uncharacterized membrane protein (DUF485 family)